MPPKGILPVIVSTQFLCTSLWFAGNAVLPDLIADLHLTPSFLAHLTSAVQLGFISGTLVFALLAIADRFSPSKVFFISALIAALFNAAMLIDGIGTPGMLGSRFLTGFFLAGIYPVGMRIASDYYQKGLGTSLGFLVGALVVGTAFPHLLKSFTVGLPWKYVVLCTSALAVAGGGAMLLLVPDGPYRKSGQQLHLSGFVKGFRNQKFRSAALGYFGHMWELYTFWAFLPAIIGAYKYQDAGNALNVPFFSFLIIASGGAACVLSGLLSERFGAKRIAGISLFLSGICCLASPFMFDRQPVIFLSFLFFWGLAVIADSPLFSTLVAQNAPPETRGTSLTIVNCIGFAITIVSIQFIGAMSAAINPGYVFTLLSIGPAAGLWALFRKGS